MDGVAVTWHVVKIKPTSAGPPAMVKVVHANLHKGAPYAPLLEPQPKHAGRNNNRPHHDPPQGRRPQAPLPRGRLPPQTRTAFPPRSSASSTTRTARANIALICYADGERRYMIAPARPRGRRQLVVERRRGADQGRQHAADPQHPGGLHGPLRRDDAGQGRADRALGRHRRDAAGARGRSTRSCACAPAKCARMHIDCRATIGEVGNEEHNLRQIGKAGANRWRGIRPTVRGVAMNPVDHPHGGGEGRTGEGRHPVSPWGQPDQGLPDPQQQAHADDDRVAAATSKAERQTMARSLKKGPFVDHHLMAKVEKAAQATKDKKPIKTWSRRSTDPARFHRPDDRRAQRQAARAAST